MTPRAWKDPTAFDPVADRVVPFLKLSYRAGPDSRLAAALGSLPGPTFRFYLKVNGREAGGLIDVPYNPEADRYEIELRGDHGNDLQAVFSHDGATRGLASLRSGELITRPDLIPGLKSDFDREGKDDRDVRTVSPDCAMHPILPLRVEAAWCDASGKAWDSNGGADNHYAFTMMVRGWDVYLKAGVSANPHGGVGFLHYRNLMSNYFDFAGSGELGRRIEPGQFDAAGRKADGERSESFLAIDYADLHILKNNCGIGLHRHRDNQEIFFLLSGQAVRVSGDWNKFPDRERCFELRTLRPGHFAMVKPGGLHALMNATDADILLLMFGGYDRGSIPAGRPGQALAAARPVPPCGARIDAERPDDDRPGHADGRHPRAWRLHLPVMGAAGEGGPGLRLVQRLAGGRRGRPAGEGRAGILGRLRSGRRGRRRVQVHRRG